MLKSVLGNAFWALLSHFLSRGSLALSAMLLARELQTSDFAAYSYFQMTAAMFAAYGAVGLGVASSRYFASHGEKGVTAPPLALLLASGWFMAILAAFVVMLLPEKIVQSQLMIPRWLLAAGVFAIVAGVVPAGGNIGLERFKRVAAISVLSAFTMVIGAFAAGRMLNPMLAMGFLVSAFLVQTIGETSIMVTTVGRRNLQLPTSLSDFGEGMRRVISVAGPMTLVSLLSASGVWLVGRMILSGPSGPHGFAMYSIGMQWFALAMMVPGITSRVLLPRFVREAEAEATRKLLWYGVGLSITASLCVLLVLGATGHWLMMLYGNSYQTSPWFLAAFLAAAVCTAPANTIGNAIVAKNGQISWLWLTAMSFIALIVGAWLLRGYGALAGAAAQGFAALLLTLSAAATFLGRVRAR